MSAAQHHGGAGLGDAGDQLRQRQPGFHIAAHGVQDDQQALHRRVLLHGHQLTTRSYARAEAKARNADLIELTPKTPYNRFTAFVRGCLEAVKQKAVALDGMPLFVGYDRVVLMAPVWAGYPAPPFNSAVELLPPGTEVEVILVSGSGNSEKSRAKVRLQIKKRGCIYSESTSIILRSNIL